MSETGVQPIIRVGNWVRIRPDDDVEPAIARGQNGVVVNAPVNVVPGSQKKGAVSSFPHDEQDEDTKYLVRLREASQEFEFYRSDFMAVAEDVGSLTGMVMELLHESPDATDAAEQLAAEENIDLNTVEGTGSGGRVTLDDVRAAVRERDENP